MNKDKYVTIAQWMVTELNLKGSELIAYALIYGLTIHESDFHGTAKYLSTWLGISEKKCYRVLNSLCERNLIIKFSNGRNIRYEANLDSSILEPNSAKTEPNDSSKREPKQSAKTEPNNTIIDNTNFDSNRDINNNQLKGLFSEIEENIKPKRFTKPTIEQITFYCKERGNNIDAQSFYDYYESVGWKVGNKPMKDWRAAVRTWERNRNQARKPEQKQLTIDDEFSKYGDQAEFMRQYVAKERADKQREMDRIIKRNMDKMKQQNENSDE